jgi:lysyl-tRNA synthetase class 2
MRISLPMLAASATWLTLSASALVCSHLPLSYDARLTWFDMSERFLSAAALETLEQRSILLETVRTFFRERGYWECETPLLSRDIVIDANIDPFESIDDHGQTLYLQTSPEAGMKRLLAAGAQTIFQVTRSIRRGESGRVHNPEFTIIEWYRVGDTYVEQMDFTEDLVRTVYAAGKRLRPESAASDLSDQRFGRLTYDEAFEQFAGTRVLGLSAVELADLARQREIAIPQGMSADDRDGWLNLLLAELVEPHPGKQMPQFLMDYPDTQAALARVRDDDPPVAERFELYDHGIELCNGYTELTDADELARRRSRELELRSVAGKPPIAAGPGFLDQAMRHGLPACSGVALGFDRLVMRALGLSDIADVIAFPADRA